MRYPNPFILSKLPVAPSLFATKGRNSKPGRAATSLWLWLAQPVEEARLWKAAVLARAEFPAGGRGLWQFLSFPLSASEIGVPLSEQAICLWKVALLALRPKLRRLLLPMLPKLALPWMVRRDVAQALARSMPEYFATVFHTKPGNPPNPLPALAGAAPGAAGSQPSSGENAPTAQGWEAFSPSVQGDKTLAPTATAKP